MKWQSSKIKEVQSLNDLIKAELWFPPVVFESLNPWKDIHGQTFDVLFQQTA